jgi:hypothetical protein
MKSLKEMKFNCKPPRLFTVPPHMEADQSKLADKKKWYRKIVELEKASQQLKDSLAENAFRHSLMLQKTRTLIEKSIEVKNRRFFREI